jgi:hypothetical protein
MADAEMNKGTPAALVDRMNSCSSRHDAGHPEDADLVGGRQPGDPGPAYPPGTAASAIRRRRRRTRRRLTPRH